MHVAIFGARSVPGRYGGYETFATELTPRLVERGFDVTVYCQPAYSLPARAAEYRGVKLVYLPAARRKAMETFSHELLCAWHARDKPYDLLLVLGLRATVMWAPHVARGRPVVFNVDGHDWKRRKWGRIGRRYLKASERMGVRLSPNRLIADSQAIAGYFDETYGVQPTFIPYGANIVTEASTEPLSHYGLKPREYFLVVARMEPENNVDVIVRAHNQAKTGKELVVVGGPNYGWRYFEELRRMASSRVKFLGALFEPKTLESLYAHSFAYVHGHEVGGTNPALLHALGAGCCILAHDVVFNREVVGDAGYYWNRSEDDLARLMERAEGDPPAAAELGRAAVARARSHYDWDQVADAYAEVLTRNSPAA